MLGLGLMELLLMLFFGVPVVLYCAICIGLVAKKLNFNPWLMGILFLIPIVHFVVLGVLAFSKPRTTM
jgi:MFS-type transporter involved in bile tolerance (Atg22 family)